MDIWHKAKKLKKALTEVSAYMHVYTLFTTFGIVAKNLREIYKYQIHLFIMVYPCIQIFKDKWFGILHHVLDEHDWLTGAQCCEHEELTGLPVDPDGNELQLQYFSRQEPAFQQVVA